MITCPRCGITSHNPNDERERYCGNCHQFHDDWLIQAIEHLASMPTDGRREELCRVIGQRIHEALEIGEVKKYATPESRFTFVFSGATDEDLAEIRKHLTPFENLIVEIEHK